MNIINPNHRFTRTPSRRRSTRGIVVHHLASRGNPSAADIHRFHLVRRWIGIGYHYIIRLDGTIERGRPENSVGAHVTGHNSNTIGIGIAGNFSRDNISEIQMTSLIWLVNDIRRRLGDLTLNKHSDLDATECPGLNFPWDEFVSKVNKTD